MLARLSIRDIVLIDQLVLDFAKGLTVLTGETGAGKSILLDSLGLALGARAERALVRAGADFGQVAAEFEWQPDSETKALLDDAGILLDDDQLTLRRRITPDGRSRGWVNDQPISQALMSQLGKKLLEIHGQNADRGLLDPASHRSMLDAFADHDDLVRSVARDWHAWRAAVKAREGAEEQLSSARADEDYIRHSVEELEKLHPSAGEESQLAEERARMMQGERLAGELNDLDSELSGRGGVDAMVRGLARKLDRTDQESQTLLAPIADALDRAAIELSEASSALARLRSELDFDPQALEDTEERLFELRRLARKHHVQPDDLAELADRLLAQLQALDAGEGALAAARAEEKQCAEAYRASAAALTASRGEAASRLDAAVMAELPPLKLEKARFNTKLESLDEQQWGADGCERIGFTVQTNPGADFGPLAKIASGGETARFILALKVVLAGVARVPVMVFDEVDQGIGGATAAAVAERLHRLSDGAQVLLVTHSPQVAARGDQHMVVSKAEIDGMTRTNLRRLSDEERRLEVARMLSGAALTDAAIEAAQVLLDQRLA